MQEDILSRKLSEIGAVLDIEKYSLYSQPEKYLEAYYKVNKIPYSLFHSSSGLIHLGLT